MLFSVTRFTEDCLRSVTLDSLTSIASQGGYKEPREYFYTGEEKIPFLYYNKSKKFLSLKEIEAEISSAIKEKVPDCNFSRLGIAPNYNKMKVKTRIEEKVYVELSLPVTFKTKEKMIKKEKFDIMIDYDFFKLYETASMIASEDLSKIDEILKQKDLSLQIVPVTENTYIYILIDDSKEAHALFNNSFTFKFAIQK